MSEMIAPDGRAPIFDGASWVSQDGRYWWNGAAWQLIKKPGFRPPIAVAVIVLALLAGAWYVFPKIIPRVAPPAYGVTNTTIDSSTHFEFDYRRSTACNDLTFGYLFFDNGGHQVDKLADEKHSQVLGNKTYHFHIYSFVAIDSRAVRFDAMPTCLA
jgi:hypothetical protein